MVAKTPLMIMFKGVGLDGFLWQLMANETWLGHLKKKKTCELVVKKLWLLASCDWVFAPKSCFDVKWFNYDYWQTFWSSLELWLETHVRLLCLVDHSLHMVLIVLSWGFNPFFVCISRTWIDSLQNCAWHVHNVNMIDAFVWLVHHMSHKATLCIHGPFVHPLSLSLSFDSPMST